MITDKEKEIIIKEYYNKTSTELADEFNVSRGVITKIWKDAGCKGKQRKAWYKDLTGQKFNFLVVEEKTEKRNASGSILWRCRCECGRSNCKKEILACGSVLKSGRVKSCGAIGRENLKLGHGLNFKNLIGQTFGKLKVIKRIEDKVLANGERRVQYECLCECGRITNVLSDNLKRGNTQSCGHCGNNSHGNTKIENLLKGNNISYEREKRFLTCKYKSYLPFDFYVENKYLIEYDGVQHFEKNTLFDHESTKRNDEIKNNWCKENNIPLIRIPYTHYDKLCIDDLKLETSKFIVK